MKGGITIDTTGLRRAAARLRDLPKRVATVREKAVATLKRRVRTEAARAISEIQLNIAPRTLAPLLAVTSGSAGDDADYLSISASNKRIPIAGFRPRVSKKTGVRVTTWHDRGEQHWKHAFRQKGNKDIKQRIPGAGPSGLVPRLPITTRTGPSVARTLGPVRGYATDHGRAEVRERVAKFAHGILAEEIRRLLRAGV